MKNKTDPFPCQVPTSKGRDDMCVSGWKVFNQNVKIFILRRFMSLLENYGYALYGSRWIICVIKSAFIFPSELV